MISSRRTDALFLSIALLSLAPTAQATIGAASLYVAGVTTTPTHFNIPTQTPITVSLCGVTEAEVGGPLPATLPVFVKSSDFGNAAVTADRVGDSDCYEFSYTAPIHACNTTIVAYISGGHHANNDLADDGLANGSGSSASGLRFLDGDGEPIGCSVPTERSSWGVVKQLYR